MTTVALGSPLPLFTPHAISVSLPTWKDNVGYEEGEKRVVDSMVTGYPRFFIHRSIQKLARICESKFGLIGEHCLLFATENVANICRSFIIDQSSRANAKIIVRIARNDWQDRDRSVQSVDDMQLHIVLFPLEAIKYGKLFWQHTGMGISSRLAERWLSALAEGPVQHPSPPRLSNKAPNKYYSARASPAPIPDALTTDQSVYLEERYGRNLPQDSAASAKRALRRRIANVLIHGTQNQIDSALREDVELGPSFRGVAEVTEHDVFLYPCGMTSIWNAHQLALATRPSAKSVAFGFLYVDTVKILEKWGPGCHFFGNGTDDEIDKLEILLEEESKLSPSPPILALFTEIPSNPLLRSANLPRLRALADKYDFLLVIDDTIGNFLNVELLPFSDIVVSSLTKIFSGSSNVMGGSLVLNPKGRHYKSLKVHLSSTYEDIYFDEDAIFMERNSRDFRRRIPIIDKSTEALCDYLRSRSAAGGWGSPSIKDVFYPKWTARENYDLCRIKAPDGTLTGGFGGLFSLTFTSLAASRAFFDALCICKGPSLGTNFSLACPYTVLAHYGELGWAAKYGVEEGLVRVSVGMESREELLGLFKIALEAAEAAK